jgi:hypothetical protein
LFDAPELNEASVTERLLTQVAREMLVVSLKLATPLQSPEVSFPNIVAV